MATVINNPRQGTEDSGMGLVLGVIIAIVLIALFWIYALPALRNIQTTPQSSGLNVNVQLPSPSPTNGRVNTSPSTNAPAPTQTQ